jgi:hypothetical protein
VDFLADLHDLGFAFGIFPNLLVDEIRDNQADGTENHWHECVKAHFSLPGGPCEAAEL